MFKAMIADNRGQEQLPPHPQTFVSVFRLLGVAQCIFNTPLLKIFNLRGEIHHQ